MGEGGEVFLGQWSKNEGSRDFEFVATIRVATKRGLDAGMGIKPPNSRRHHRVSSRTSGGLQTTYIKAKWESGVMGKTLKSKFSARSFHKYK